MLKYAPGNKVTSSVVSSTYSSPDVEEKNSSIKGNPCLHIFFSCKAIHLFFWSQHVPIKTKGTMTSDECGLCINGNPFFQNAVTASVLSPHFARPLSCSVKTFKEREREHDPVTPSSTSSRQQGNQGWLKWVTFDITNYPKVYVGACACVFGCCFVCFCRQSEE